jgi:hypothetical protein
MVSKSFDITEDVVNYLSHPPTQQSIYKNTGMLYDFAVNGNPFLIATSDDHPYTRAFAQMKKDQIDQSLNPGEQSLTMWWTRNQSDFSGGAGIKYYEPVSDERVMRSYVSSVGINPWNIGEISLHNSMTTIDDGFDFVPCLIQGTERIVSITATTITVRNKDTLASVNTITGQTGLLGIIAVNDRFVVWNNSNVYVSSLDGTTISAIYNNTTGHTIQRVWFVKQRFIVFQTDTSNGKSNLTEQPLKVSGSSSTLGASHIYEHPNSAWKWTDIVATPQAILAAGYAGNQSAVLKFSLTETGTQANIGTIVKIGSPITAMELPIGEWVTCMSSYLGGFLGIGTNLGFRAGIVDDYGNITYGQLVFKTDKGATSITQYDSYFYVGVTNGVGGQHGCYRVNLSDQTNNTYMRLVLSEYSWATDVYISGASGTSGNVTKIGVTSAGKILISTDTSKLSLETSTKLASGTITMGQIRYNTYENKLFKKVSVKGLFPTGTKVDINSIEQDGTTFGIYTIQGEDTIDVTPRDPQMSLGFQLVLYSDSTNTYSPTIKGFQTKSLPAVPRQQNIQFSLLCFDYESDMHGNKAGGIGKALLRFAALVDDTKLGDVVLFQDFHTGENLYGIVEELEFNQVAPPRPNTSGFGGIVTIRIKTVY